MDRIVTTNESDVSLTVTSTNRLSNLCASLIQSDGATPGPGLDAFQTIQSVFVSRPDKQRPVNFLLTNAGGPQCLLVLRELTNGATSVLVDLNTVLEVEIGMVSADGAPVEKPTQIESSSTLLSSRRPSFYNMPSKESADREEEQHRLTELGSHNYQKEPLPSPSGARVGLIFYMRFNGPELYNGRPVRMDRSATVATFCFEEELLEAVTGKVLTRTDTLLRTPHASFRVPKVGDGDAPFVFGGDNQTLLDAPPDNVLPLRKEPQFSFPFQQTLELQVDEWLRKKSAPKGGERGSIKAVAEAASEYAKKWEESSGEEYRRVPFLVTPECILSLLAQSDAGSTIDERKKALYSILHASDLPEIRALGNCFNMTIFLQHVVYCAVGEECFSADGTCRQTLSEVLAAGTGHEVVPWMKRVTRLLRAAECFGIVLRLNSGMEVAPPPQEAIDERLRQDAAAEQALAEHLKSLSSSRQEFEDIEASVRDRLIAVHVRERDMYFEFHVDELRECEHRMYRFLMREVERRGRIQIATLEAACRSEVCHRIRDFQNEAFLYSRIRAAVEEHEFRCEEAQKIASNVETLLVERGRTVFAQSKLREALEEKEGRLLQKQQAQNLATIIAEICDMQRDLL